MKYLIAVDDCYLDRPGGMARVAWDIALLMRDAGHDVAMFCAMQERGPFSADWSESDGIRILQFRRPVVGRMDFRRMHHGIRTARRAADCLARESWDIVHSHSPYTGIAAFDALAGRQPMVATVHSPVVMELQIKWAGRGLMGRLKSRFATRPLVRLERRLLAQCAGIHVLSRYTCSQLDRMHGLGDRTTVIPHWRRPELHRTHSRTEARRRLSWPEDMPILFTVRAHVARTGVEASLRAIGPLARDGRCRYMIGGDGELRAYHERLSSALGFDNGVTFLGRMSDEDLVLAYEAADCFILPTLSLECFGIIILEALALGCPVISTDAAAIPETMQPILPDFIVPAGDIAALQAKVADFLDGRLTAPAGEILEAYVAREFDASVIGPRIRSFLEQHAAR